MRKSFTIFFVLLIIVNCTFAQRGKDGAKTVTATEVVNAYTTLTVNASIGNTSLTVANSSLITNFSSVLTAGDLIMIIQVQGATINNSNQFVSSWGEITNYNNCGNYEFLQVESVPNATTINLDCPLNFDYTASGNVVVVRVPRYSSLTINAGGIITADTWNGSIGGIIAIEVNGTTTVNGSIDVSNLGFRGGQIEASSTFGGTRYADNNPIEGAEKGEGIGGDQVFYSTFLAGRYTRGAAANGGGGGNGHNAGGAGGANTGNPLNWTDGSGVSDPIYNISWALETPSLVGVSNSGGGRGGYSHASTNGNELTQAPGDAAWGGDLRRQVGGLGGRPLDYSTGKIFMGGAGGAGDGETAYPGAGGNGAGIIFLNTYGNVNGTGTIVADGQNGYNCEQPGAAPFGQVTGKDAAGGAGAGGTILIKTTGIVAGISINANGGEGGDQVMKVGAFASIGEAEGPGGGGGGGYIAVTSGTPTRNANGGINGTTNSTYVSNFPPNGATSGGVGMPNESIDAFDVIISNDTICSNSTATLTASIIGTAPIGAVFEWYDSPIGGTLLFSGNPFTTPILVATTTYYVRVCPAPYRVPVTVYIDSSVTPTFTTVAAQCSGAAIAALPTTSNNGIIGTWSPAINNTATTTYTFTPTAGQCATTTTMTITITPNVTPTFTAVAAQCSGVAIAALPTTSNNGIIGTWSPAINNTATTTYTFAPTAGQCATTTTMTITVNPLPTVVANATSTSICTGDPVTLTGSGAASYTWDNSVIDGIAFTPGTTTTYTVIGTDGNGCQNSDVVTVVVNNCGVSPVVNFNASDSFICVGDCIDFNDLSAGTPSGWTWYFFGGATTNSTNQNPTTICYNTAGNYDVALVVTNAFGQDSLFMAGFITVNALPTIIASASDTNICLGDSVTLIGSGAENYSWFNNLGVQQDSIVSPNQSTAYFVSGIDTNGCIGGDNIAIFVTSCTNPIANISSSKIFVCITDCINFTDLSSGGTPTTWSWNFYGANPSSSSAQNPSNICYDSTGTYHVSLMVSNVFGQDSIYYSNYITVDSCRVIPIEFMIPNVFSPNGDGQNDIFTVTGTNLNSVSIAIYNRWGELLYQTNQLNEGWNGRTNSGTASAEGTYFYLINVNDEFYKGTLTLIR